MYYPNLINFWTWNFEMTKLRFSYELLHRLDFWARESLCNRVYFIFFTFFSIFPAFGYICYKNILWYDLVVKAYKNNQITYTKTLITLIKTCLIWALSTPEPFETNGIKSRSRQSEKLYGDDLTSSWPIRWRCQIVNSIYIFGFFINWERNFCATNPRKFYSLCKGFKPLLSSMFNWI